MAFIQGRLLFKGGYNYMHMLKYAYARIIVCILFSASVASQMDESFYFESIVHGHHIYKTVWTLQKAGEIVGHVLCELSQTV